MEQKLLILWLEGVYTRLVEALEAAEHGLRAQYGKQSTQVRVWNPEVIFMFGVPKEDSDPSLWHWEEYIPDHPSLAPLRVEIAVLRDHINFLNAGLKPE